MIVEYRYLNSGSVDRWRRKTSLTPLNWLTVQDHYTQCDHFQQFYNRHNVKVHVPIIRWSHCATTILYTHS